jgi:hypothetical protein
MEAVCVKTLQKGKSSLGRAPETTRYGCAWLAVPQPTEWQSIGNQIDVTMIFTRANFVSVHHLNRRKRVF